MNLLLRMALACVISALFSLSALAATLPWSQLTPAQQEALAPLSNEWNALPESQQQQHFIKLAKRYPKLDPVQKQRLHQRLIRWGKLTPEQRKNARDKFQAFSKVPIKDREQV